MSQAAKIVIADQIREIERARLRALVNRDMALAWQLHAPEFQLVTPTGRIYTRDSYLSSIEDGRLRYLRWTPGEIDVRMQADSALIRYQATLEVDSGNGQGRAFQCWHIDSYELDGTQWQVVWSQATEIKASA
jgi:hypothetical protein